MKLMSGNNLQAAMAREIKLAVGELSRTLNNMFKEAQNGLSDRRDVRPNPDVMSRHGFSS